MRVFHISVLDCTDDGEGQAPALREEAAFFHRALLSHL